MSGKVLEETYRKWVQYKEDCFNTIRNESPPQSKQLRGRGNIASDGNSKGVIEMLNQTWGFLLSCFLFGLPAGLFCNRTFDRYACWPDTPAGVMINISCPFYLPWYDKGNNKKLKCLSVCPFSLSVAASLFWISVITGQ